LVSFDELVKFESNASATDSAAATDSAQTEIASSSEFDSRQPLSENVGIGVNGPDGRLSGIGETLAALVTR